MVTDNKKTFTNKKIVALIATLCCFLWGSAYPAVKNGYLLLRIAPADISSKLVFAGYRFILAGIILLIVAQLSGIKIFAITKDAIFKIFILGLTQTMLQYIFFYVGLANTTGVKGSIMNSMGTFFSVVLAHYLYKNDKLSAKKIIGCIVGFLGVMIANFSMELFNFSFNIVGEGFIVIAAFIFSASAIYGKKLTGNIDVMLITGYNLFMGGVMLALIGLASGGRVSHFTPASSALLIYMAILSATAFSLWTLLLKYNKVGVVSIYNFLIPIFGVMLSSIFLGENILEVKNMVALLLVCAGIWMVNKSN
ncbi:DMT family transporter [Clostridium sp. CF012]|uniref:DMT family transporter n=1 Tax=Clostridium sp. CF012 TaxID=2843319 RepID=UPI001C0B5A7A|nr:DMT family transporter [Clostridium sp. CF012]MBU3141998.1 DMT family transporter [Clostridium sp. CF012]